jgi:hemerythrin-like metal-binding protein
MSENLMGLLMLGEARNEGREPFTPEKIRLAQTIGDSAAIAIRRMLLREQTERRLEQLVALSEIDLAIISSSDMAFSLGVLLLQVIEQLKVDAAAVWLFNPTSQTLEFVSGLGFRTPAFENAKPLHVGDVYVGQAALERRTIHVPNLTTDNHHPLLTKALAEEPFISYYAVPLIVKGQVKGVLELFHRTELESNEEWLKFLHALANQAAIAIDNSSLFNDLQLSNAELTQAYDATIQGWSRALDLRDNETEGHTQRVTELTMKLGRQFGLPEEQLIHVRRGALLHDIGKMGVPDGILLKPGPLTAEEWVLMRKHTTFAYELLSPIHFLLPALDIPYCHHEKWDGTGYPRGLSGDQIPFAARIFALVDVWDALTSDRPYRAAWPEEKVLDHIRSLAGTHFDPQVVKICLEPGMLKGQSKRRILLEPVQWSEKFSVGVRVLDQQHQQLIKLLNRLISATGTISTHSETVSDILTEMTRYAQVHFKAEERLMEAYGFPGLEEQKIQHRDFRKKTVDFCTATTIGVEQIPEALLEYLVDWLTHHILEDDIAYRSFFKSKGVE